MIKNREWALMNDNAIIDCEHRKTIEAAAERADAVLHSVESCMTMPLGDFFFSFTKLGLSRCGCNNARIDPACRFGDWYEIMNAMEVQEWV